MTRLALSQTEEQRTERLKVARVKFKAYLCPLPAIPLDVCEATKDNRSIIKGGLQ